MCLLYLWDPDDPIRGIRNSTPGVSGPTAGVSGCYNRPIFFRHLMRLDLHSVVVGRRFVNFSNCPSLEHLKFRSCYFEPENDSRLHICAPSLVSLLLDDIWGLIPSLESMPSLLKAAVTIDYCWESFCDLGNCNCEFCHNSYSIGDDTGSNDCVLLKGLSEAKDLALISGPETVCLQFHLYLNHIMSYH